MGIATLPSMTTGTFHHARSCFCTMCRDAEGNQHPVFVATFTPAPCAHETMTHANLNQPETAAICPRCGRLVEDYETIQALREKRREAIQQWKREGK